MQGPSPSSMTSTSSCTRLVILYCCLCFVGAFSQQEWSLRPPSRPAVTIQKHARLVTALLANNNNGDNADFQSSGGALELTSMLSKLDRQWKIQQAAKPRSRWTKIVFEDDETSSEEKPFDATGTPTPPPGTTQDFVYLLEPPQNTVPSCMIVFVGGAGLGQFPNIAYKEFLERLSGRLNAAVITAPYTVGLDHFSLAKKTGELSRRAVEHCQDDATRLYPTNLPVYCVTHSLGGKLATIHMAATQQKYAGVGLISFNNYGFADTIRMAREFAGQIRQNSGGSKAQTAVEGPFAQAGGTSGSDVLNQVFSFAETFVGSMGLDFSPSPDAMKRLIGMKYDEERQSKTRLFVFDDDTLDSTQDFKEACEGFGPDLSGLPGTHLTPVYFKLGLEELPEEARGFARQAVGGIDSASFGNEEELNALVDEVSDWILGKGPSRKPKRQVESPRITGTVVGNQ